ncbi:MAG: hypothetical protein AAF628_32175 [Planctomycetota bacterium]
MSDPRPVSNVSLILWPTLLTVAVNVLRLVLEVQGSHTTATGGAGAPLGISWFVFPVGAYVGWRLRRAGSAPRLRLAWLWSLLAMAALIGAVAAGFSGIDRADTSDAAYLSLRDTVTMIILAALALAAFAHVLWTRLATALLFYGVLARLTVVGMTWLAKDRGWDTHYTKFGPAGIEVDMGETLYAATAAQLGFWVSFTVVAGGLAGCVAAAVTRPR